MPDSLDSLASQLRHLATADQREAAATVLARTRERRLRVLVAGEAKRGKSTILNRLTNTDLLPTGTLPVTSVSTTVCHGDRDELIVHFLDGHDETLPLTDLAQFVTEHDNPRNHRNVAGVDAWIVNDWLAELDVELVDTPGTGSVYEHNTQAARDTFASLDAVIMVLSATPPISSAERDLLAQVSRNAVATFVVLNKTDQLEPGELADVRDFTTRVCADVGIPADRIYAVSARNADPAFQEFRATFTHYLKEHGQHDADRALRGHLFRLAQSMLDEATVEHRAIEMTRGGARAQVDTFRNQLHELKDQASSLADRCRATQQRLRRELDVDADTCRVQLGARARQAAEEAMPTNSDLQAVEIEQHGHAAVQHVVTSGVLDWREQQARGLEGEIADLVRRLDAERLQHLDMLRRAAADELGIAVTAPFEPLPLQAGRAFWLDFAPDPAVELPWTQLLRRHGPGAAGRARRRVLGEIAAIVDRQVGRARADLQQRLSETIRRLTASLQTNQVAGLQRLHDATLRVTAAAAGTNKETGERLDELTSRTQSLSALIRRIDTAR